MKKTLFFCLLLLIFDNTLSAVTNAYTSTYFNGGKSVKTALSFSINKAFLPRWSILFGLELGKRTQIDEINYLGDVFFADALFEPRYYPKNTRLTGLFIAGSLQAGVAQIPYTSSTNRIVRANFMLQYGLKIGYSYTPMELNIIGTLTEIGIEPSVSFSGALFTDGESQIKNTFWVIAGLNMVFDFPYLYRPPKKRSLPIATNQSIKVQDLSNKNSSLSNIKSTNSIKTDKLNIISN